jgi:hypothetical protein
MKQPQNLLGLKVAESLEFAHSPEQVNKPMFNPSGTRAENPNNGGILPFLTRTNTRAPGRASGMLLG